MIHVENISKRYKIGETRRHGSLRDAISSKVSWLFGRRGERIADNDEIEFWALKDISFDVNEGEAVGIIGKNGSGKSTLLKILSHITYPTEGRVRMDGRLASIIEVGTGFHPDLSGRENIFMNGALHGMSRKEMRRKFDEIVEFAGVEKFIDTPVKHYSSGMYIRLAFSVVAHLEPDILIIDEVLAVGDADFQRKCLEKMEKIATGGTTVLFVSHDVNAISTLTSRAIYLDQGRLISIDETESVINTYCEGSHENVAKIPIAARTDREGNGKARIIDMYMKDDGGKRDYLPLTPSPKQICLEVVCSERVTVDTVNVSINTSAGARMIWVDSSNSIGPFTLSKGQHSITVKLAEGFSLAHGQYFLSVHLASADDTLDHLQDAVCVEVEEGDFYSVGKIQTTHAVLYVNQSWKIN